MKERVLDVLMYLFDHCVSSSDDIHTPDEKQLVNELESAGFCSTDIDKAFDWLDGIHKLESSVNSAMPKDKLVKSFRIYSPKEMQKLDIECRSFLLFLEQIGILDFATREVIIDRVIALEINEIRLEHLKWVTLMILVNRDGDASIEWLEDIIFSEYCEVLQ